MAVSILSPAGRSQQMTGLVGGERGAPTSRANFDEPLGGTEKETEPALSERGFRDGKN